MLKLLDGSGELADVAFYMEEEFFFGWSFLRRRCEKG